MGSISEQGRSPGERYVKPLQYSGLENLMNREVWWAIALQGHKELDMTEATERTCMHIIYSAYKPIR